MNAELHCYPSEGGFTIQISALDGLTYWLEYYLVGAGGYQESGEISGIIASQPEVIYQAVSVPVVEIGIVSMSLGGTMTSSVVIARSHRLPLPDLRHVPLTEVEIIRSADFNALVPRRV